jgi:hypothetical protein
MVVIYINIIIKFYVTTHYYIVLVRIKIIYMYMKNIQLLSDKVVIN